MKQPILYVYCQQCSEPIDRTGAPWRTTYCGLYCAAIAVTNAAAREER